MKTRLMWTLLPGAALAAVMALYATAADEPAKGDGGPLVVIDGAGKEQKLKTWKSPPAPRPLAWLPPAEKDPDPKDKPDKDKPEKDRPDPKDRPVAFQKAPPKGKPPAAGPEA